ncbi:MAG: STAS domain-containing protein [Actinomycetota bacterium]
MVTVDLALESRNENGWAVLQVRGEVDLYTSPQLRDGITELLDQGANRIVIDLSGIEFMDSTGLGVLVVGLKRAKERNGEFALVCREGSVQKILSITGLDRVFSIHGSVAELTRA